MRFLKHKAYISIAIIVSLLVFGVRPLIFHGAAASLPNRSLQLADSRQGATTEYKFDFGLSSAGTLGSIRFQFCSDTPLVGQPCTAPDGFIGSGSSLVSQQGVAGFTMQTATSDNVITITSTPTLVTPGHVSFTFKDVISPSAVGSYYVRIQTYAMADATGPATDSGGLAFAINDGIGITTTVPPFLLLCNGITIVGYDCSTASGDYINFGELSSTTTKAAKSEMVIATNAPDGYSVYADGSTLTSFTNTIPGITALDVSRPGTSQFGINLAANTSPNMGDGIAGPGIGNVSANYASPDRFRFNNGELLGSAVDASDYNKYTTTYIVNIQKDQSPGIYISTLTYVCLANF